MSNRNKTDSIVPIVSKVETSGWISPNKSKAGSYVSGCLAGSGVAGTPVSIVNSQTDWIPGFRNYQRFKVRVAVNSPTNNRGYVAEFLYDIQQDASGALIFNNIVSTGHNASSPTSYVTNAVYALVYTPPIYSSGLLISYPNFQLTLSIANAGSGGPSFIFSSDWNAETSHVPYS